MRPATGHEVRHVLPSPVPLVSPFRVPRTTRGRRSSRRFYPSKNSAHRQPFRITAAVAFLTFPFRGWELAETLSWHESPEGSSHSTHRPKPPCRRPQSENCWPSRVPSCSLSGRNHRANAVSEDRATRFPTQAPSRAVPCTHSAPLGRASFPRLRFQRASRRIVAFKALLRR